jgi:HPt (histidine-containing phosphotransfer) domain-containing protein
MHEPDPPILDEATLADVRASVADDAEFVADLVRTYLSDGPTHLAGIADAVAADDAAALVRPAHTLKSSSATIGAMRISARARRIEMAARAGTIDAATREDAAQLGDDWGATTAALEGWLAG